eukprot:2411320-Amphidinium_carterae.1
MIEHFSSRPHASLSVSLDCARLGKPAVEFQFVVIADTDSDVASLGTPQVTAILQCRARGDGKQSAAEEVYVLVEIYSTKRDTGRSLGFGPCRNFKRQIV